MMSKLICFLAPLVSLCALPANAQDLPPPIQLYLGDTISTLDGSGNHVGRLSNFSLTLSRQYTPSNKMVTVYRLTYFFGNGNGGETQGGSQSFKIDLLDGNNRIIVADLIGPVPVPRYQCWYGGGSPQQYPVDGSSGTIGFDYVGKSPAAMRVTVSRVQGAQGGC